MWANIDFMSSVFDKPEKTKEIVEVPKKDMDSVHTLTSLKSVLITPKVIESKIVLNYLEESWCIEDENFINMFNETCKQNLWIYA